MSSFGLIFDTLKKIRYSDMCAGVDRNVNVTDTHTEREREIVLIVHFWGVNYQFYCAFFFERRLTWIYVQLKIDLKVLN